MVAAYCTSPKHRESRKSSQPGRNRLAYKSHTASVAEDRKAGRQRLTGIRNGSKQHRHGRTSGCSLRSVPPATTTTGMIRADDPAADETAAAAAALLTATMPTETVSVTGRLPAKLRQDGNSTPSVNWMTTRCFTKKGKERAIG